MSVAIHFARAYDDVVIYLALRRYELEIPSRAIDTAAGLADGHLSKLEAQTKIYGRMSFPTVAATPGVRWWPAEDGILLLADDTAIPLVTRRLIGSRCRAAHGVTEKRAQRIPAAA